MVKYIVNCTLEIFKTGCYREMAVNCAKNLVYHSMIAVLW